MSGGTHPKDGYSNLFLSVLVPIDHRALLRSLIYMIWASPFQIWWQGCHGTLPSNCATHVTSLTAHDDSTVACTMAKMTQLTVNTAVHGSCLPLGRLTISHYLHFIGHHTHGLLLIKFRYISITYCKVASVPKMSLLMPLLQPAFKARTFNILGYGGGPQPKGQFFS